jgi:uncharacterized protein (DUF362 family)
MNKVAATRISESKYPEKPPYSPSENYPEYPFQDIISTDVNHVYAGVRRLLYQLGFDKENFGTAEWNPLGHIISPGQTIVLKPNFVLSSHKIGKDLFSIITHPSVLRAIGDYAWIALKGSGKIIIADAPQYDCNWSELVAATGVDKVVSHWAKYAGPDTGLRDLRPYWSAGKHFASMLEPLDGDPLGSVVVNLGNRSALYQKPRPDKLYGAVYQRKETIQHHFGETHEYQISRTILDADVVISVPKLKVHKKVGVTLNVKGLVGINTNKNYLVHYSITPPSEGGDQYPDGLFTMSEKFLIVMERWMYDNFLSSKNSFLERVHRSIYWLHNHTTRPLGLKVEESKRLLDAGNWYGNDSAWRMAVDLLKIFRFADRNGRMQCIPQRKSFTIIDGIIGGDVNGPLTPDPVDSRTLLAGENVLAVDLVATRLMGFDPMKVRMHTALLSDERFDFGVKGLEDIQVLSDQQEWSDCVKNIDKRFLGFREHPGWIGHLVVKPNFVVKFK